MVKKRYVGIDEENNIVGIGIELKRSDWCNLSKKVLKDVINQILIYDADNESIINYLNSVYHNLRNYDINDFILSKIVDVNKTYKVKNTIVKAWINKYKYEKNNNEYKLIAPHNEHLFGISYIFSQRGGVPVIITADNKYKTLIDYDFYFKKQILPPVERLLSAINFTINGQKSLFSF